MEELSKKRLAVRLESLGITPQSNSLIFFKKTASTFDSGADIVVAASQTSGRGRLDRNFFSPKGGIYFCVKIAPVPLMTISVATGIMRAMEEFSLSPKVKWVNDILVDGKKVCGILCKSVTGNTDNKTAIDNKVAGNNAADNNKNNPYATDKDKENDSYMVAGVGINYCIKKFPAFIKNRADSLFSSSKGINEFAALAIKETISACSQDRTHENLLYYRERLAGLGQDIVLPDGNKAVMTGIDDDGSLIYFKDGKNQRLIYGDIYL